MAIAIGDERRIEPLITPLRVVVDAQPDSAMTSGEPNDATEAPTNIELLSKWMWAVFAVFGVVLLGYLIALLSRSPGESWTWLDGWTVCGIEVVASFMCIIRGLNRHPGRSAPLFLGCSLLSWSIGDICLTVESLGGRTPATPSVADFFYILFYPLAYIATVQLVRRSIGRLTRPNWLDGVVAGLGAAAVCAAFAFHDIVHLTGGNAVAAATNLAYPIGDLLLLSLAICGTVLLADRRTSPWVLLAAGISLNVVGDTFNLLSSTNFLATVGADVNAIAWPVSILLMSMSVWMKPRALDPLRRQRVSGFLIPSVAAFSCLVILVVGSLHPLARVALALATATLITVGIRLSHSARTLRLLTEERHRQAQTDELTGLGNRRQLLHVVDTYFTDFADPWTTGRRMAFLYIDLNRFKEINDSFGHPAGDELLRQLGPRLTRAVPTSGTVFRLGGDELAVILIDADAGAAVEVAERILEEITAPFLLQKMSATVGASIGIALSPEDASEGTGLMWCADTAMYRAKLGNIPYVFYDQDVDGDEQQLNLVEELRDAVDEGAFVLHYQPLLNLRTGEILAVEALIRWPHPRLGLVPPDKFLPLAEDAGFMQRLTEWVLGEALGQCAMWRASGQELAVSVNVTTTNLLQESFVDLVTGLLAKNKLPGEALVIEITETSIISDFARSKVVIERFRDIGVVVSIDDFGAGFTSLAYLSGLAVGELKLDRTFITGLGDAGKERELELVRATINLGHEMELRVVAEGIEDVATLELLGELGCDLAQGYYISRPMPANKLAFVSDAARLPAGVQ
jgi:diguanylate cyclase (GGDEF)-like protein